MDSRVSVIISTGQRHEVEVCSSDTVQDLKTRLQVQTRVPMEHMCITFEDNILEDGHKLSECRFQPNSVLNLWIRTRETGLSFTVKTEMGTEHEVHMDSTDPIKTLKVILQEITECPTNRQKLMFNHRRLEDERPLGEYGIQQASVVHMMIHKNNKVVVIVKTFEGKKLFIDLDLCDTVEIMKVKIQDHNGTPVDQMGLMFATKQLEDGRTLSDYNLTHLSTVHQILILCGGWYEEECVYECVYDWQSDEVDEMECAADWESDDEDKEGAYDWQSGDKDEDEGEGENRGRSLSMDNLANFNH